MLELKRLRFAYAGQQTPYNFSLKVEAGEIVTITGRSGSGKSTLLDLIAGFRHPQSGELVLESADLLALPPETRPVSILFQTGNLFDHLDVQTNLSFGLPKGLSASEAEERIAKALAEVGLSDYASRRADQLSGGQQQRVALARTLLRQRPVLLLDEPFANLDGETATDMRELVKNLTRAHKWHTLVVSHLPEDAKTLADRVYALSDASLAPAAA